jgi:hypothetical protein
MAHFRFRWSVIVALLFAFGCGGASPMRKESAAPASQGLEIARSEVNGEAAVAKREVAAKPAAAGGGEGAATQADPAAVKAAQAQPMIVYSATLDVIVKDLDTATAEVDRLVTGHKGWVAKSEVKGDTGSRRTATYTLRVPVDVFNPVKAGILALGTPERNVVDTQDVTEEFVDVEARIKNLKEQEAKLNELLKEKRKEEKLEDVIKVSDRIYVVRGDIERAQGRRNYLQNRVQHSTLHVTLREIKDYKPPTAPTFGTRISDTFEQSWEGLVDFGSGLALVGVALVPWIPLWLPALVALVWAVRRLIRLSRENAAQLERERPRRTRLTAEDAVAEVRAEETERVDLVKPPEEPRPPA